MGGRTFGTARTALAGDDTGDHRFVFPRRSTSPGPVDAGCRHPVLKFPVSFDDSVPLALSAASGTGGADAAHLLDVPVTS